MESIDSSVSTPPMRVLGATIEGAMRDEERLEYTVSMIVSRVSMWAQRVDPPISVHDPSTDV
jgi:hypothetical protein